MELLKLSNLCITGSEHKQVTDNITGEICCKYCGLVIDDEILVIHEKFNSDELSNSQHYPVSYQMGDKGLGSIFDKKGAVGNKLSNTQRNINVGRNQTKGLIEFAKISDKLNLPDYIIEEATKSFIFIRKEGFLKGREVNSIVGACIYLFSKKNGLNITFKEISAKLSINKKTLFSYYRDLLIVLELDSCDMKIILPVDYFEQISSNFMFDIKVKNACLLVINKMQKMQYHEGKNPVAVCASAIYLGCQNSYFYLTQKDISFVCGISEVTIRNIANKYLKLI